MNCRYWGLSTGFFWAHWITTLYSERKLGLCLLYVVWILVSCWTYRSWVWISRADICWQRWRILGRSNRVIIFEIRISLLWDVGGFGRAFWRSTQGWSWSDLGTIPHVCDLRRWPMKGEKSWISISKCPDFDLNCWSQRSAHYLKWALKFTT